MNLQIPVCISSDENGRLYGKIEKCGISASAWKDKELRKQLTSELMSHVTEHLNRQEPKHLLVCKNGTILVGGYTGYGRYGYTISRADVSRSSMDIGANSMPEVIAQMREHASQCFDGISWEQSLVEAF